MNFREQFSNSTQKASVTSRRCSVTLVSVEASCPMGSLTLQGLEMAVLNTVDISIKQNRPHAQGETPSVQSSTCERFCTPSVLKVKRMSEIIGWSRIDACGCDIHLFRKNDLCLRVLSVSILDSPLSWNDHQLRLTDQQNNWLKICRYHQHRLFNRCVSTVF